MYIREYQKETVYQRKSKCGTLHEYTRQRTHVIFRCDNCGEEFERERGKMDPKRLSNNYFHVCNNCNSKEFAQRKGVERRKIWDLPASSDLDISKL